MSKPKFSYSSGHKTILGPGDVINPSTFTRYLRQQTGVELPVGDTGRGVWYRRLSQEMMMQGWTWPMMVKTVKYIRRLGIRLKKPDGVFYYVEKANGEVSPEETLNLEVKVAAAIAKETDDGWKRRLSLAQGVALERVFAMWKQERANAV